MGSITYFNTLKAQRVPSWPHPQLQSFNHKGQEPLWWHTLLKPREHSREVPAHRRKLLQGGDTEASAYKRGPLVCQERCELELGPAAEGRVGAQ